MWEKEKYQKIVLLLNETTLRKQDLSKK